MKNSLFKKIIAVSLALSTLMFAGCSKDKPVSEESPSESITQNIDESTTQDAESTDKEETESTKEESSKKPAEDKTNKQEATETKKPANDKKAIDLKTVKLSQYGISSDYEISKAYPILLGNVYVVRDYCEEYLAKTYIFVTTTEKVLMIESGDCPKGVTLNDSYEIYFADLDGEKGEEILFSMFNGGNGGPSCYIYKVYESRIAEMEQPADPDELNGFSFRFEAPFKMVVTHECNNEESVIEMKGNEEHERFFNKNGTPAMDEPSPMFDSYLVFEPIKLSDGSYGVRRAQSVSIGSHANCAGWAETIIKYNKNTKQFAIVDANFYDADYDIYKAQ